MEKRSFGKLADGREVSQYVVQNANGMEIRCINYGCRFTHILLPDKNGGKADIVQGFDTLAEYEADTSFQGAAVGRYGNRIAGAAFTIKGQAFALEPTQPPNFLHGNFSATLFKAQVKGDNCICFTHISPDGDQGFPGELVVEITYTLTDDNELILDYRAVSNKDTHLCLTNHAYFNLSGQLDKPIYDQTLMLDAPYYVEVGEDLIPTGRLVPVAETPFDFLRERPFAPGINDKTNQQIKLANGYDHCFAFQERASFLGNKPVAVARHGQSGRAVRMFTTEPAVQLYTTNGEAIKGKGGKSIGTHCAFCLETEHYPNSPNMPDFPSTLLRKGDKYHTITLLCFEF